MPQLKIYLVTLMVMIGECTAIAISILMHAMQLFLCSCKWHYDVPIQSVSLVSCKVHVLGPTALDIS